MTKKLLSLVILVLVALFTTGCIFGSGKIGRVEKFQKPDIKDEFCGMYIDFRYCKCAFHGDYCKDIGMSKSKANQEVQRQYDEWVKGLQDEFAASCEQSDGIFKKDECSYCAEEYVRQGDACVAREDGSDIQEEDANNKLTNTNNELLDSNCQVKADVFDQDWLKYSDIDNVIPYEDRSWEAKQVYELEEKRIGLLVEKYSLQEEQAADQATREVLEEYRQALVQNIKTNLLKSFWRLSWITYSTIDSGRGLGKSYAGLLEGVETIGDLAKGVQVVQGLVPSDSALAIDTGEITGKVKSVSVNTALEAVASLGDPVSAGTELVKSSAGQVFPSADLTAEEINILKEQHLNKGVIDQALQQSQAREAVRIARLSEIDSEIAQLEGQISSWRQQEKDRVKFMIEESCKK